MGAVKRIADLVADGALKVVIRSSNHVLFMNVSVEAYRDAGFLTAG